MENISFQVQGFRGYEKTLQEIQARAAAPITSVEDSSELLGDLATGGPTTPVGHAIADIILGKADSQSKRRVYWQLSGSCA